MADREMTSVWGTKKQRAAELRRQARQRSRGREAVEARASARGKLQQVQQNRGGNFGAEGLQIGAEDIAELQAANALGTKTAHKNVIDLNDPKKANQITEIKALATQMGLTPEQTDKALSQTLSMQNAKEQLYAAGGGADVNAQDLANRANIFKTGQIAAAGKGLTPEQLIVSNLAAMGPTAYKEVDLEDPIHVMNLSSPLKMLQTTNEKAQQDMLKRDPTKTNWTDTVGGMIPYAMGAILTAASAGTLGPALAGAIGSMTASAASTKAKGGDWGDVLKSAAIGAGTGALGGIAGGIGQGLSAGIGGTTGKIAGGLTSGVLKGFGGEALSMLSDGKFDLSDALTSSAIAGGGNVAMSGLKDLAAGTDLGASFGIEPTTTAAIPTDEFGTELSMADRLSAGLAGGLKGGLGALTSGDVFQSDAPSTVGDEGDTLDVIGRTGTSQYEGVGTGPGGIGTGQGSSIGTTVDYSPDMTFGVTGNMYEPAGGPGNIGGIGTGIGSSQQTTLSYLPMTDLDKMGGQFEPAGAGNIGGIGTGVGGTPLTTPDFTSTVADPYKFIEGLELEDAASRNIGAVRQGAQIPEGPGLTDSLQQGAPILASMLGGLTLPGGGGGSTSGSRQAGIVGAPVGEGSSAYDPWSTQQIESVGTGATNPMISMLADAPLNEEERKRRERMWMQTEQLG